MPPAEQEVLLLDLDLSEPGRFKVGVISRLAAPVQWGKERSAESESNCPLHKAPLNALTRTQQLHGELTSLCREPVGATARKHKSIKGWAF